MSNFEQGRTSEEMQERVPKWKKLLSLNSASVVRLEYPSKTGENEKIEKLRTKDSQIDHSFKIIEKKRKKDKIKDEMSKEEGKKKKKKRYTQKETKGQI